MRFLLTITLAVAIAMGAGAPLFADEHEIFIPSLVYRTGPYAPNGIQFADGFADYLNLINLRDGGINGVAIRYEECDTAYNNDRGVECYERLKSVGPTGAVAVNPLSTGITYAIIERAERDKIPVISMGYGRADASDGRIFPYVFTLPTTYWAQADAIIHYIANEAGGYDKLKGKKIALVYHDSAYGKEPIATLKKLAADHGFRLYLSPVTPPGLDQKSVWLKVGRQIRPDWTLLWGWGVMNQVAIKEAIAVGYPMEKMIGAWWSGSEVDVLPAGPKAEGYKSATWHAAGAREPVHRDLVTYLYDKDGNGEENPSFGTVLYNRGLINAAVTVEGIRTAMKKFGDRPLTGEEVRWGLENLNLSEEDLEKLGLAGLFPPIELSCADHEGGGKLRIQEWSGTSWRFASDWIVPDYDMLRPMYRASAEQYAKEKGIEPRNCEAEAS